MNPDEQILPAHIESTIDAIAAFHTSHERKATSVQRAISAITTLFGRSSFHVGITIAIVVWIGYNAIAPSLHEAPFDPPPFIWLQGVVSIVALYMTMFILATQQRDDVIAGHREQLTLELAMLGDRKSAKIIELIEALRRDDPDIDDRVDVEALAMAEPTSPSAMFERRT